MACSEDLEVPEMERMMDVSKPIIESFSEFGMGSLMPENESIVER